MIETHGIRQVTLMNPWRSRLADTRVASQQFSESVVHQKVNGMQTFLVQNICMTYDSSRYLRH